MKTVSMIGEGAWGTAVSTLLAHNGYTVKLWCHDKEVADQINKNRINERYFPGIKLHSNIYPTTNLEEAMSGTNIVFEAIPVKYLRSVLEQMKQFYFQNQIIVVLSKGIEKDTLLLPTQMIDDVFKMHTNTVVLAGPSFAHDLAKQQITAVDLASTNDDLTKQIEKVVSNNYFRPYLKSDVIGVQVGSALKNALTLGIGLLDGAGYTDNTKNFVLTCGLQEMVEVAQILGGKKDTLYGLSGVGDLVATAMGKRSRNLEVGKRLGAGEKLDAILKETGYTPEGINTVQSVHQFMKQNELYLPIFKGIFQVIFEGKSVENMLKDLMERPIEKEVI